MRMAFAPYRLLFKEPGGTSRGVMTEKPTFLIRLYDERQPEIYGIGEAGVFPGLSPEADGNYVNKLIELLANIAIGRPTDLSRHPSIQAGLEQAIRDFTGGCRGIYFPSAFTQGESEITINGLIWMGDFDTMMSRVEEKLALGFHCLKLKIGAIDWQKELEMIRLIRNRYSENELQIRVDANGAFSPDEALGRLRQLAELGIHSIEQPIKAGNPELMATLCRESPLPIALDEELIGKFTSEEKRATIETIRPAYIILKPSLIGGFSGAQEWIGLAEEAGVRWWVTSALESNVGLNALAQWTASLGVTMPQGLGTGGVFTNNFTTPLSLHGEKLSYSPDVSLDHGQFANLHWNE